MFSTQSPYGFTSCYQKTYTFHENMLCSYAQGYLGVYPDMLRGWYTPASSHEVSPWAWQWSEGMRTQEGPFGYHSYTATITQPRVQLTYAVDQAPPAFSRVVGGPVSNANQHEIVCPRPIHPLPKWIDMSGWEDDEGEAIPEEDQERSDLTPGSADNDNDNDNDWKEKEEWSNEEDYGEEFDIPRRFLPSFILSPDPEDLPAPLFHLSSDSTPSPRTLTSLSPDACDLPQPHFDSNPYPLVLAVNSRSSVPGVDRLRSPQLDSFESIVSPDPEDLPSPDFEICDRSEVGGFELPGLPDHHQDRPDKRGTRDHAGWGFGEGLWKVVTGGGRKVWLDWDWDR
ncbi:hypothetical protein BDM02DRAFT_3129548 [Thelephora ganbajun]|uniref:Uncharacterized protein n=1 Tax=Thelephora ganbajun TaxID=370292 RepID=A0ACB6ZDS1_THEGA|nr:hypothetical protein BDM02DRAFT_3129548 [Thelephora ganbajun]